MFMDGMEFETRVLSIEARLYRIARSMLRNDQDCGDALQEGILKAWQRLHALRDERCFDAWLTCIVINECRNLQRGYRRRTVPLDSIPECGTVPADPCLMDALSSLPEKYRLILTLHHGEGFTVEEIAVMLHLPNSTVKWRLHEGRRLLSGALCEEVD
jgi:RNA polymerase sigma-70 factor (ECF subfamily)